MINILIVDDSPTEVALIEHIINSAHDMAVIGVAKNGQEAIELTKKLKPDLITMDIQMPVMDGLSATRMIMAQNPTPIVVISSLVNDESIHATFHILEAGALTALAKPENMRSPSFAERSKYILDTLRSLADIRVTKKPLRSAQVLKEEKPAPIKKAAYELIAIGASVGGPMALKTVLAQFPANFPIPIVVVQHMSNGFIKGFAQWLGENINLKVKNATDNERLEKATVYIAPERHHLEIQRTQDSLVCTLTPEDSFCSFCPSITKLFQSAARTLGRNAIGILLTGMSDDGAEGLLELKQAGGHTLIQGPESSIVFGMGAVALSMNAVDQVIELERMASYLLSLCSFNKTSNPNGN